LTPHCLVAAWSEAWLPTAAWSHSVSLSATAPEASLSLQGADLPCHLTTPTRTISNVGVSIKDIVHERAWVRANAFAVGVRILAETRNRKHSKELFKLMREAYGEVEILGYYDSPEDYVAGNLHSTKFEAVEEESPFDGGMNIQYNVDRRPTLMADDMDVSAFMSPDTGVSTDSDADEQVDQVGKALAGAKLGDKMARGSTRLN